MTTEQIATRLVELVNTGQNIQAEEELYADNIHSYEQQPERNAIGKEAVIAKTNQSFELFIKVHEYQAKLVGLNNNSFMVEYLVDAELANGEAMKGREYAIYLVKDGQITDEYFFFTPDA